MRKHSKTMSMGLMPATYLVQLETFISPGLPYLSLIGLHDEDRRIRNRIRAACKAVADHRNFRWPATSPNRRIHGGHAWIESTHAKMVLNMVWIPDKEIVMFNSLDVLDDLVPVSELSNGRTTAVLNKADRAPVIIIKRNKPSYVLMGINDYQDLLDRLEDTEDARLAEKRIDDNNGRATIPNADLMAELGLTEEDIAGTPTPEMA